MVLGQSDQLTVAEEVGSTVAHMRDQGLAFPDQGADDGTAHALEAGM